DGPPQAPPGAGHHRDLVGQLAHAAHVIRDAWGVIKSQSPRSAQDGETSGPQTRSSKSEGRKKAETRGPKKALVPSDDGGRSIRISDFDLHSDFDPRISDLAEVGTL